ncbi:hypothetical protein LTR49_018302 [Elasticomyces elasticus]|nr:hypothetical protein LTR49_018302 [Elasticomyces elasticus]KAK5769127.1 hypothetical protein LTS12_000478 [Elasticomyces elasticus]
MPGNRHNGPSSSRPGPPGPFSSGPPTSPGNRHDGPSSSRPGLPAMANDQQVNAQQMKSELLTGALKSGSKRDAAFEGTKGVSGALSSGGFAGGTDIGGTVTSFATAAMTYKAGKDN